MRSVLGMMAGAALVVLSACAGGEPVSRATGAAPLGYAAIGEALPGTALLAPKYAVREVRVEVPRALVVSEANMFYPLADIVWRGEPRGDRYDQVQRIFTEALGFGTNGMANGPDAIVEVQARRFHALTEKTRYTTGGVHSIRFDLTVRDAKTGAILEGPRLVIADVKASGGRKAIEEDQTGRTQRVVIIENLSQVIRRELSTRIGGDPVASSAAAPVVPPAVTRSDVDPARGRVSTEDMVRTVQMSL